MNSKKTLTILSIILTLCIISGIGMFLYNGLNGYTINDGFKSLPLNYDAYTSSSTVQLQDSQVTIYGGFIKGIQKSHSVESLVLRALSPLPSIEIKGSANAVITLRLENINPDFYAESISGTNMSITRIAANTLQFTITVSSTEAINIEPELSNLNNSSYQYAVLGDNRDGYDTFGQMIQQINGDNMLFVIDNGDLVFSGKPNQYRLFDQMVSKVSTTLCTTMGNHDIRGNGLDTYRMLYGPAYYSFDFMDNHFVFLDSSPGWANKQAISEEQYQWLEQDLKKAQGKHIYVISHIPPIDPRNNVTANEVPNYVDKAAKGESWAEQRLNNYFDTKIMAHGFQDPQEAQRFENIMSTYHVDTVYLSHIHSYFEYSKDNVRYVISGGAGAELLSENSYYHYMIAKTDESNLTMIELPSPTNNYLSRLLATANLFINAMYKENPSAVILISIGFILLLLLLLLKLYFRRKKFFDHLGQWIYDVIKYASKHFKEMFRRRNS